MMMISNMNSIKRAVVLAFALFTIGALAASAAPPKANVKISSLRNPINGTIAENSNVHDVATVADASGQNNQASDPSGTVQFYICHKNTGTANDYPTCTSPADGVMVGSAITLTECNNGTCTVTSPNFATGANGTYCFLAEYSGDVAFNPATDATTPYVNKCFFIGSATAVTVSSMSAQLMAEGGNWYM
jgi:hypothetical protein